MIFSHSKNRLEALSDGVFAFAATLMVVNIGVNSDIISFKDEIPNIISFAVSFFIMMGIWKIHYNYFRRTNYVDNWVIALNMILLFTVLFYIFPVKSLLNTALNGTRMTFDEFSQLFQLYSLGFAAIFLCIVLMYYRAFKKDTNHQDKNVLLFYTRHFSLFVIVAIISLLLAKFKVGLRIGVPGYIYASLGLLCWWHSVQFQKKHPFKSKIKS